MRSIDVRPPLTLWYRRTEVIGFWVLGCAIWGTSLRFLARAAGLQPAGRLALGAVALAVAPGIFWRPWFQEGIRAWNGMAWRVAARLRSYALKVTYYVLIAPMGERSSNPQPDQRPQASGWIPIADPAPMPGSSRETTAAPRPGSHESLRAFTRTPGREWAVCIWLLAFLLNLLADDDQDTTPPGSTYTLY